jgi:cytidylate kinase
LQADYDIRAKRRLADFEKINEAKNINEIKEDLEIRDKYDSTRKLSPLKKPEDAIIIDTTLCSFEEQVNQILKHIEN